MTLLISLTNQSLLRAFSFDAPQPWQILFQDAATKIMDNITDLHHGILFFLVLISTFVIYMTVRIVTAYRISNSTQPGSIKLMVAGVSGVYQYPDPPAPPFNPNFVNAAPVNVPVVPNVAAQIPTSVPASVPAPVPDPLTPWSDVPILIVAVLAVSGGIYAALYAYKLHKEEQVSLLKPEPVYKTELRPPAEGALPFPLPKPEDGGYANKLSNISSATLDGSVEVREVLSVIPFICLTGSLNETFMTVFLALLRKGFIYILRQQIAGFWKVLLCCKVGNAHFHFFAITLIKNLFKISPHSHNITIKTKIVILYTAHQISLLLKKGNVVWK